MAESQGLEAAPLAEIVPTGIDTKHQILVADAVLALTVYSRLVGSNHSRNQRLAVEILPDVLRPFVDVEIESHPMARSVAEIALGSPEWLASQCINLAASGS